MAIKVVKGDITKTEVDCIVNAANNSMLGGGGVDGAIHRAAGPKLLEECQIIEGLGTLRGALPCPTGHARLTGAYKIKTARFIIHTVGPRYDAHAVANCRHELRQAYINTFELAKQTSIRSIAFPAISCGVYGYPLADAVKEAVDIIRNYEDQFEEIIVCVMDDELEALYDDELAATTK